MPEQKMRKIQDETINWTEEITKAEDLYKFQPELTAKLDNQKEDFTDVTLLEIVLWKTNRYPEIKDDIVEQINMLRNNYSEERAKEVLRKLLLLKGFDLPMASTVLRFAVPLHLQIIDKRVYRFINEDVNEFKVPYNNEGKVQLYFSYIAKLKEVCTQKNIPFEKADRILYQLDKNLNSEIPIKY
ncbi:hypothetical protein ACFS6H_09695 [Terrimonas rubra]|uniref:Uncharacterized protein n=1 Tax=Terrimonas rubra TaxID=1035890 RepID=A0ABW6A3S5_9BACT